MAYSYITSATTTQVGSACKKVVVVVNTALTGTIKVIDGITGTTANVATITNPGVGAMFTYFDLNSGVRIVTSATCDITVLTTDQSR